jgi:hypothetical protein
MVQSSTTPCIIAAMGIDFRLRFDRSQIAQWASRYTYPGEGIVENEIAPRAKKDGYLSREDFLALCKWKTPRSAPRCETNDEDFIRSVTSTALSTKDERLRIEVLTLLCGVEWPTASVIRERWVECTPPIAHRLLGER